MNKVFDLDADIEFGTDALPDWRKADDVADADDEEMKETPADVLMILGFDPKDCFDEYQGHRVGWQIEECWRQGCYR